MKVTPIVPRSAIMAGLGDSGRWLDCGLDGARVADTKAGRPSPPRIRPPLTTTQAL